MNKRNQESKNHRRREGFIAIASNSVSSGRNPLAFAQQLLAAPRHSPAMAPGLSLLSRVYNRFMERIQGFAKQLRKRRSTRRKLDVLEIQQLGEKRFVAIVRVGKQKFLIGGAATSVSLLAEINSRSATVMTPRSLGQETA